MISRITKAFIEHKTSQFQGKYLDCAIIFISSDIIANCQNFVVSKIAKK